MGREGDKDRVGQDGAREDLPQDMWENRQAEAVVMTAEGREAMAFYLTNITLKREKEEKEERVGKRNSVSLTYTLPLSYLTLSLTLTRGYMRWRVKAECCGGIG